MPLFVALRLSLVGRNGFSPARIFHQCCGNEGMSSGLLAAAESSLICLEELLSESAPIIGSSFPAYLPLVSAFIFTCSNLIPRMLSRLAPKTGVSS
jgi:hypothetical protein